MYAPAWSPTEHVFTVKDEDGDSEGRQKSGMCMLPEEVLPRVLLEQNVYVRIPKLTRVVCKCSSFYFRLDLSWSHSGDLVSC